MALLFMDGLDLYASEIEAHEGGWQATGTGSNLDTTAGVNGGVAFEVGGGGSENGWYHNVPYGAPNDYSDHAAKTYIFQAWVKSTNISVGGNKPLLRLSSGADEIIQLDLFTSGAFRMRTWDHTGLTLHTASSTGAFASSSNWQFLELSFTLSSTVSAADASWDLKIDGSSVYSNSGFVMEYGTTNVQGVSNIYICNAGMATWWWDDIILMDDTGADANLNGFTGARYIDTINVDGDGGTVDWTRNTGTNDWEMVDDPLLTVDDDTTYVESSTVGQEGRYALATPSNTDDDVHAVQIRARLRKDDAGTRTIRGVMNVSGGTEEVTFQTLGPTTEYVWYHLGLRETNDTGGTPWTATEVGNTEIGVEIVS